MENTLKENFDAVNNWLAAVRTQDVKKIIATLHPDYEYELEYSSIKGRVTAEAEWKLFLEGLSDFRYETVEMLGSGDIVAARFRMKAVHTGPFRFIGTDSIDDPVMPKENSSGNPIDIPTSAFFRISDGLILRLWSYWDTATLVRQMEA